MSQPKLPSSLNHDIAITIKSANAIENIPESIDRPEEVIGLYEGLVEQGNSAEAEKIIETVANEIRQALDNKLPKRAEVIFERVLLPLREKTPGEQKYFNLLIENIRLLLRKTISGKQRGAVAVKTVDVVPSTPRYPFEESGRFHAIEQIGTGGMGCVYEVLDMERGAGYFALKTLHSPSADDITKIKREFRYLQKLNHPNLVKYHELFEQDGLCYFTMDRVAGTDFYSHVCKAKIGKKGANPMPINKNVTVDIEVSDTVSVKDLEVDNLPIDIAKLHNSLVQLAQGLNYMHQKGVVHRDIKPHNILVNNNGKLIIIDFGLVRRFDMDEVEKTASVSIKGTPMYMAPEQFMSDTTIGPAADWYAVGVMLYETLTGKPPFHGNLYQLFEQKKTKFELEPPHKINPDIPLIYSELCMDLMQIKPVNRPRGEEVLNRLLGQKHDSIDTPINSTGSLSMPIAHTPLVGREKEMTVLEEAMEKFSTGNTVAVMAVGKSGVGKSKFVREFAENKRKNDQKVMLLSGVCYEQENVIFKALNGAMDSIAHLLKNMPPAKTGMYLPKDTDLLAKVFPVLKRIPAVANFPINNRQYEPQESKKLLFRAVKEFLERLSLDNKIILVIDDLQWADKDSVELLHYILEPPESPNIMMLLTSRKHPKDTDLNKPGLDSRNHLKEADLNLPGDFCIVPMNELEKDSAGQLVKEILKKSGVEPTQEFIDGIVNETGSPYYLQELARHALTLGSNKLIQRISLDDALRARIEKLNPVEQKLLAIVCATGRPLIQQIIFQAGNESWGLAEFFTIVSTLRDEQLVRTNGLRQIHDIEPFHDRVRETVVKILEENEEKKRQVHEGIAKAMQTLPQPDLQALATHWEQAGEYRKAYDYALKAAVQAEEAFAFEAAANFYLKAIELADHLEPQKKSELYEKYGDALDNLGKGKDAADAYIKAFEGSEEEDRLKSKSAGVLLRSGHIDLGLKMLDNVLRANGMQLQKSPLSIIVAFLWVRILLKFKGLEFDYTEEKNIPKDRLKYADLMWDTSSGLTLLKPVQAHVYSSKMMLEALKIGEPERILKALNTEAVFSGFGGLKTADRTNSILEKLEEMNSKMNTTNSKLALKMSQFGVEYLSGRFHNSKEYFDEVQNLAQEAKGIIWRKNVVDLMHFWARYWLGNYKYLAEKVPELINDVEKKGDKHAAISFKLGFPGIYLLAQDKPDQLESLNTDAMKEWPGDAVIQGYSSNKGIVFAKLYKEESEQAYQIITSQINTLKKARAFPVFQVIRMECYHMLARSALQIGGESKLKAAEKAAKNMTKEGLPFAVALAQLVMAAVNVQKKNPEQAIKLLEEAIVSLSDQKMASYEASAKFRLGRLIGGERGRKLVEEAYVWAESEEIVKPEKIFQLDAPGFETQTK